MLVLNFYFNKIRNSVKYIIDNKFNVVFQFKETR